MFRWITLAVLLLSSTAMADWHGGLLTNEGTSQLEGRIGFDVGEQWEVGVLGRWFSEDLGGADWGAGGYLKMSVDPNGTIPLADWIPLGLGEYLQLPDTINVETYLIGKLLYTESADGDPLGGAVGAGFQAGPATLEIVYSIVETGEAVDPMQSSGMEVWFGAVLEF